MDRLSTARLFSRAGSTDDEYAIQYVTRYCGRGAVNAKQLPLVPGTRVPGTKSEGGGAPPAVYVPVLYKPTVCISWCSCCTTIAAPFFAVCCRLVPGTSVCSVKQQPPILHSTPSLCPLHPGVIAGCNHLRLPSKTARRDQS